MVGNRQIILTGVLAVTLAASPLASAAAKTKAKAKKHPAPKHPEAVHPASQKGTKHAAPKATKHSARKVKGHKRGQMAIDNTRAQQIQQALAREHYLNGNPSGTWDSQTQEAMRRYQSDQGWQTKEVPDSRALIRLGLGPDKGHLLNPDSAMVTDSRVQQSAANIRPSAPPSVLRPISHNSSSVGTPATAMPNITTSR